MQMNTIHPRRSIRTAPAKRPSAGDIPTGAPSDGAARGVRSTAHHRRAYAVTVVVRTSVLAGSPTEAKEMASLIGECLCDATERVASPFAPSSARRPTSATGSVREEPAHHFGHHAAATAAATGTATALA